MDADHPTRTSPPPVKEATRDEAAVAAGIPGVAPPTSPYLPAPPRETPPVGTRGIRPTAAEREATVARLLQGYVDDRLTMDEYSQRLTKAYGADTDVELAALVADLPEIETPPAEPARPAPQPKPTPPAEAERDDGDRRRWLRPAAFAVAALAFLGLGVGGVPDHAAVMGGTDVGVQDVLSSDNEVDIATLMGGAEIDLRGLAGEMDLRGLEPGTEVTIDGAAVMGGMEVIVDAGTQVNLSGLRLMGGGDIDESVGSPDPGMPIVNVHVNTLMGGIEVTANPDADDDDDDDPGP